MADPSRCSEMLLKKARVLAIGLPGKIKRVAHERNAPKQKIDPYIRDHPGQEDGRSACLPSMVHNEERNGARKGITYAWKEPENGIPAKADVSPRNKELIVHDPGEELNLVQPLLGRHSSGQIADEISGCGAAGAASAECVVATTHC
jgi:hypothetical protein